MAAQAAREELEGALGGAAAVPVGKGAAMAAGTAVATVEATGAEMVAIHPALRLMSTLVAEGSE